MIHEVLAEKCRVQERLAKEAGYDISRLSKNAHAAVHRIEKHYSVKFKYANIKGGHLVPVVSAPSA